jgi:hypothetical protein
MTQPKEKICHGYPTGLEEIIGRTGEDLEQEVIEMVIENLATEWHPEFDGENVYTKGKKNDPPEGCDVGVDSIVQSARGAADNQCTVVIAAAFFIYEVR